METARVASTLAAISSFLVFMGSTPSVVRAASSFPVVPPVQHPSPVLPVLPANASFSGRAIAAQVNVTLPLPATRIYADTGELASAGGNVSASLASITDVLFTSGPVTCGSQGMDTLATSSSVMANLHAFVGTGAALSCTSLRSDSRASCSGVTGSSTFSGLVFAGVAVVVSGAANQTIILPGVATLVINEQVKAAGSANIQVNALHLTLATGDELILCASHSDIAGCATPTRSETWGKVKLLYR